MKATKKVMAMLLAAIMMLAMNVSAFALTDGVDITIEHAVSGAEYTAYRLLDTTTSLKSTTCHDNVQDHQSSCYNVSYTVNEKYAGVLETETGKTSDSDVYKYILAQNTAEAIRAFADHIFEAIGAQKFQADKTVIATGTTVEFSGVESGYWLIVEKIDSADYKGAYSLVMLDTAGSRDIKVATKREELTLTKSVQDNGTNYGVGADMQIGDTANFLIVADIPNPIGYATYTYVIHDQMGAGFTLNEASGKIHISAINGPELDSKYYSLTPAAEGAGTMHITIDIKKATADGVIDTDDRFWITYSATLNEKANILVDGTDLTNANKNSAWLEYSNDPYHEEKTTTTTPSDVYVWTFPLELNKVDGDGVALNGAKFVLSLNKNLTEAQVKAAVDNNGKITIDEEETQVLMPLILTESGNYRVAPKDYTGAVVYEIPVGTAKLEGFNDQVDYYLYETASPAGYNPLSAPVHVKFFAQYKNNTVAEFDAGFPKVSVDGTESSALEANVVNNTGTELPETGGIGTTIFYILGAVMVLGAVVLLITKKRMSTEK